MFQPIHCTSYDLSTPQKKPYVFRLTVPVSHVQQVMSVQCEIQLADTWNLLQVVDVSQGIFCFPLVTLTSKVVLGVDCFFFYVLAPSRTTVETWNIRNGHHESIVFQKTCFFSPQRLCLFCCQSGLLITHSSWRMFGLLAAKLEYEFLGRD